jgi:hypothetical protein
LPWLSSPDRSIREEKGNDCEDISYIAGNRDARPEHPSDDNITNSKGCANMMLSRASGL